MQQGALQLREARIDDSDAVMRLNEKAVAVTSPMDADQYRELLGISDFAFVAQLDGEIAGFLLAIREGRPYENGNYRWFTDRLKNFLYIDRVVIDEAKRGVGLGRSLYAHLFTCSLDRQIRQVAAEIDIEPPNAASLAFHERHGFVELGSRILDNGKRVSMQVKALESEEAETQKNQAQQAVDSNPH